MPNIRWEDILQFSDIPLAISVILIVSAIRPFFEVENPNAFQRLFKGDRSVGLVLVIGMLVGILVELTTPEFDVHMAVRRVMATAGFASLAYKAYKSYGQ